MQRMLAETDKCFPSILQSNKMYRQILYLPKVIENLKKEYQYLKYKKWVPVRKSETQMPERS